MRAVALTLAVVFAAGPALADETAAAAADKDAYKNKIVCKTQQKANSRFNTKVCLSRAEWEFRGEQHRKAFDEIQNRPVISIEKGN